MPLHIVISDLDGTVLETEDYHRRAYNALFDELEIAKHWTREDYSERLAQVGGEKLREVFGWLNRPEEEYDATRAKLYERKTELYAELIVRDLESRKLPLRPGVRRLFDELQRAGIPIAIASTCVKWAALDVIKAALGEDFLSALATVCAGDDVTLKKPHPDIFLLAAKECGFAPENCLVLEDTGHGLQAARRAGMICVATPSELALHDSFKGAHLLAENLDSPHRIDVEMLKSLMDSSAVEQERR